VETRAKPSTVLVVEDEEAMVYVLKKALSNEGYRVLVAMDGAEAIEVHEQHRNEIDLALIDLS
jgi:CheY-like chemotaxis protein